MGMYTELSLDSDLKCDTPEEVIQILKYMLRREDIDMPPLPDHPLFATTRWSYMLRCGSAYFAAQPDSKLLEVDGDLTINIICNLKNYEDEIEKFLDWIHPWLDCYDDDFLGYTRYEEDPEPTLLYYHTTAKFNTELPENR